MSNSRALTNGKDETRASTEESVKVLVPAVVVTPPQTVYILIVCANRFLAIVSQIVVQFSLLSEFDNTRPKKLN